jgi:nucleoside-diphosphate kinase
MHPKEQRTLILLKPDALQRSLLGEVIHWFERKGLRIVGLKMIHMNEVLIEEHYGHHKDKPFFNDLKQYISSSPVVAMVLTGIGAVNVVRLMAGPTKGHEAPPGTIRGDFAMVTQNNLVHASDSVEAATVEIKRFFKDEELFDYAKVDFEVIYGRGE